MTNTNHKSSTFSHIAVLVVFLIFTLSLQVEPIFTALFDFSETSILFLIGFVILLIPYRLLPGWEQFGETRKFITPYVQILALILAAIFVFDKYDLNNDTWHLHIRLAILISGALIWRHPYFLLIFTIAVQTAITGYFSAFDRYYVGHYNTLILVQVFALAIYLVHFARKSKPGNKFIVAIICIHLGSYFLAGITKVFFSPHGHEWIFSNDSWLLPLNAELRGWRGLYHGFTADASAFIKRANWFYNLIVVIIEIFTLFAFSNKRYFTYKIVSLTIFHIAVFIVSGVLFWIWILHNLILLLLVLRNKDIWPDMRLLRTGAIYTFIFALTFPLTRQVPYTWFDTRFQWFVTYEVHGPNGESAIFNRNDFGLYSEYFTQEYVSNTLQSNLLSSSGYGGTYPDYIAALESDTNRIENALKTAGKVYYTEHRSKEFMKFIQNYFTHQNIYLERKLRTRYQGLPKHLYMFNHGEDTYAFDFPIDRIDLRYHEYYFQDKRHRLIGDTIIHSITIAP